MDITCHNMHCQWVSLVGGIPATGTYGRHDRNAVEVAAIVNASDCQRRGIGRRGIGRPQLLRVVDVVEPVTGRDRSDNATPLRDRKSLDPIGASDEDKPSQVAGLQSSYLGPSG
jgi:hypothetical protein